MVKISPKEQRKKGRGRRRGTGVDSKRTSMDSTVASTDFYDSPQTKESHNWHRP